MTSFLKELAKETSVPAAAEVPEAAPAPAKMVVEHLNLFYGDFQGLRDINLTFPEKQVTALISALTGKTVRGDICMTGEITLRGRVLPVGGIKEKVLAGVARGIGHVILPAKNQKDLEEIPQELRRKIVVHTVDSIDDVLPLVFEKK